MDKEMAPRSDPSADGDLGWWPNAFIVVVDREWEETGFTVCVFGLWWGELEGEGDACDEEVFFFFFKPKDAYIMLSSLVFGDEYLEEIGEDGLAVLEREGVDYFSAWKACGLVCFSGRFILRESAR